jgi:hypothetical protein
VEGKQVNITRIFTRQKNCQLQPNERLERQKLASQSVHGTDLTIDYAKKMDYPVRSNEPTQAHA